MVGRYYLFIENVCDPCILTRGCKGIRTTLIIYVDDVMIMSRFWSHITAVIYALKKEYDKIEIFTKLVHSYIALWGPWLQKSSIWDFWRLCTEQMLLQICYTRDNCIQSEQILVTRPRHICGANEILCKINFYHFTCQLGINRIYMANI